MSSSPVSGNVPAPSSPPPCASSGQGFSRLLIVMVALCVGAVAGYGYARHEHHTQRLESANQQAALRSALAARDTEALALRGQLDGIAGELAMERGARDEMQRELGKVQSELGEARDQLAFYEQLVPTGPQGQVDVSGAELERAGQALRYRVLLTRNSRSDAYFDGRLQFEASGVLDGKPATLSLEPMRVEPDGALDTNKAEQDDRGLLSLRFARFQRSQGLLALPPGFDPKSVVVRVLEGDAVRASRKVDLAGS